MLVSTRYGWHRDELYFLEASKHLDWGFVDQPPFTPFVAWLANRVAPGNLAVLRLLPAIAAGATAVLGGVLARELGAGRRTQILSTAAVAGSGFLLGVGHLLATATFDLLAWMAMLWVAARLLRTGEPRWWVAFGAVAGVALLNKDLAPLLTIVLLAGIAIERRWALLRTRWLVLGGALAVVIAAPNLIWQATNDWPQLQMARALSDRLAVENRVTLLPLQVLFAGPLLAGLLIRGSRWLGRDPEARPFRPLLWAWPAGVVLALVTAGRPYYVLPLTITVLLAGIVASERRGPDRWLPWRVAVNTALTLPLSLPLLPLSTMSTIGADSVNQAVAETVGWPELADQVATIVDALPAADRGHIVLLTGSYGEAGALDRFGPARGLPPAFSPHNNYWYFRQPTDDDATVVAIRFPLALLEPRFDECEHVADVDNGLDVENEAQGQPIIVCRGLQDTWDDVWPELRFLS